MSHIPSSEPSVNNNLLSSLIGGSLTKKQQSGSSNKNLSQRKAHNLYVTSGNLLQKEYPQNLSRKQDISASVDALSAVKTSSQAVLHQHVARGEVVSIYNDESDEKSLERLQRDINSLLDSSLQNRKIALSRLSLSIFSFDYPYHFLNNISLGQSTSSGAIDAILETVLTLRAFEEPSAREEIEKSILSSFRVVPDLGKKTQSTIMIDPAYVYSGYEVNSQIAAIIGRDVQGKAIRSSNRGVSSTACDLSPLTNNLRAAYLSPPRLYRDAYESPSNTNEIKNELNGEEYSDPLSSRSVPQIDMKLQRIQFLWPHLHLKLISLLEDESEAVRLGSIHLICAFLPFLRGRDIMQFARPFFSLVRSRLNPREWVFDAASNAFAQGIESVESHARGRVLGATQHMIPSAKKIWSTDETSIACKVAYSRLFSILLYTLHTQDAHPILNPYMTDVIGITISLQLDRSSVVQLSVPPLVSILTDYYCDTIKNVAVGLVRCFMIVLGSRSSNVRIAGLDSIDLLIQCEDSAKLKGAGSEGILHLSGGREPNVLPISTFYGHDISVNYLASLVLDASSSVGIRFQQCLRGWCTKLPDRMDWYHKLLPYVVSGLAMENQNIQAIAVRTIEDLGFLHEAEKIKDILEYRQYGSWGIETVNYSGLLPPPFSSISEADAEPVPRPSPGALLFIRSHCTRYLPAILNDLDSYQTLKTPSGEDPLLRSCRLLSIFLVYLEESVTQYGYLAVKCIVNTFNRNIDAIRKEGLVVPLHHSLGSIMDTPRDPMLSWLRSSSRLLGRFLSPQFLIELIIPYLSSEETSIQLSALYFLSLAVPEFADASNSKLRENVNLSPIFDILASLLTRHTTKLFSIVAVSKSSDFWSSSFRLLKESGIDWLCVAKKSSDPMLSASALEFRETQPEILDVQALNEQSGVSLFSSARASQHSGSALPPSVVNNLNNLKIRQFGDYNTPLEHFITRLIFILFLDLFRLCQFYGPRSIPSKLRHNLITPILMLRLLIRITGFGHKPLSQLAVRKFPPNSLLEGLLYTNSGFELIDSLIVQIWSSEAPSNAFFVGQPPHADTSNILMQRSWFLPTPLPPNCCSNLHEDYKVRFFSLVSDVIDSSNSENLVELSTNNLFPLLLAMLEIYASYDTSVDEQKGDVFLFVTDEEEEMRQVKLGELFSSLLPNGQLRHSIATQYSSLVLDFTSIEVFVFLHRFSIGTGNKSSAALLPIWEFVAVSLDRILSRERMTFSVLDFGIFVVQAFLDYAQELSPELLSDHTIFDKGILTLIATISHLAGRMRKTSKMSDNDWNSTIRIFRHSLTRTIMRMLTLTSNYLVLSTLWECTVLFICGTPDVRDVPAMEETLFSRLVESWTKAWEKHCFISDDENIDSNKAKSAEALRTHFINLINHFSTLYECHPNFASPLMPRASSESTYEDTEREPKGPLVTSPGLKEISVSVHDGHVVVHESIVTTQDEKDDVFDQNDSKFITTVAPDESTRVSLHDLLIGSMYKLCTLNPHTILNLIGKNGLDFPPSVGDVLKPILTEHCNLLVQFSK